MIINIHKYENRGVVLLSTAVEKSKLCAMQSHVSLFSQSFAPACLLLVDGCDAEEGGTRQRFQVDSLSLFPQ